MQRKRGIVMAREEHILDDYLFLEREEYERARQEEETMEYLTVNIGDDKKELLKIYNRAIEKKSFQTVIGLRFLYDLRHRLIESGIVSEDILAPIPVGAAGEDKTSGPEQHYKELYEAAMAAGRIKNMVIGVLVFMILGMIIISVIS